MLFRLHDLPAVATGPLVRWMRRADTLAMDAIYSLYLTALPRRRLYLEYRFLALAQALEAYHARKMPSTKKRTVSFQARIEALVDALPHRLRSHVPPDFPGLMRNTRNYLTHWNPRQSARAASGARLEALTRAAKLFFELSLLLELGFGRDQVRALVEENSRLVRDFDAGFRSL